MAAARRAEFMDVWLLLGGFCVLAAAVLGMWFWETARLPDNVGRTLTMAETVEVIGRNSPLTQYVRLSTSADFPREEEISKITIHHMAGDLSLEKVGEIFGERDRRTSANYSIDSDGRVGLYVEECNRPWSSKSKENDSRAVTIEVANDQIGDDWHVSDAAYETLIDLCVDICQRNGIPELVYTGDGEGSLTLHKMFYSETECPGPYLESKIPEIVYTVNTRLREA